MSKIINISDHKSARQQQYDEQPSQTVGLDFRDSPTTPATPFTWERHLIRVDGSGVVSSCLANAMLMLEYHPDWCGVLGYDQHAGETNSLRPPPLDDSSDNSRRPLLVPWTDIDDIRTAAWLQRAGIGVGKEIASQAVQAVAQKHLFHPIRDYLNSLNWDGEERLPYWLTACLGVEYDSEYITAVASKFLISAVARILEPGCKVDTCLILEGKQGKLKSTALQKLVGTRWFTDEIPDIRNKDAAIQLRGKWLIELGELGAINNVEMDRVKSFLSRSVDRYRPVNGRYAIDVPRQSVFAGSVNHREYLRDETGGRRFWPIETQHIDIDLLLEWRDQLWAEAVHCYRAGARWWMDRDDLVILATAEQQARYQPDAWEGQIASFTQGRSCVTTQDILSGCLKKEIGSWNQHDTSRVSRCLVALGFEKVKARTGGHGTGGRRVVQFRRTT